MNIIIPMAGRGERFSRAGFTVPKPLIPVRGVPMYAWAVASLPIELATHLVFVCLREHLEDRRLAQDIRERFGSRRTIVVPIEQVTPGQACTVMAGLDAVDPREPLLIYNADTFERGTTLHRCLAQPPDTLAGLLSVFQAVGDRWSFARVDEAGRVLETAEKQRISNWCSTGLYWFRSGLQYRRYADQMIQENQRAGGEFYVAPIYNLMIKDGLDVRIQPADEVWVMGTPEDLKHFEDGYQGPVPATHVPGGPT